MINKYLSFTLVELLVTIYLICISKKSSGTNYQLIDRYCTDNLYKFEQYCGIGIKTKKNHTCIPWKYSKWNDFKLLENTTICKYGIRGYWCVTKLYDSWDYCKNIECKSDINKYNLCHFNISWTSSSSSININFPVNSIKQNGILILFNQSNIGCSIISLCKDCRAIKSIINYHFQNCNNQLSNNSDNHYNISISDLIENNIYKIYLIPIINNNSIGNVFELSLQTKCKSPSGIRLINKTTNSITLTWNKHQLLNINNDNIKYQIEIIKEMSTSIQKTKSNSYKTDKLHSCKKYCFIISVINGTMLSSDRSIPICVTTSAIFDEVYLFPTVSVLPTSRTIRWEYNNTNKCSISFVLEYWENNNNRKYFQIITNETTNTLTNLKFIQMYSARVYPRSNGENGSFSNVQHFFNEKLIPTIKHWKIENKHNGINITMEIDPSNTTEQLVYIIDMINDRNECLYLLRFHCGNCSFLFNKSTFIQNKTILKKYENFENCKSILNHSFYSKINLYFSKRISMNEYKMDENITINLYSVNAFGLNQINVTLFHLKYDLTRNRFYYFIIILIGVLSIIIILIILIKTHKLKWLNRTYPYEESNYMVFKKIEMSKISSRDIFDTSINYDDDIEDADRKIKDEFDRICLNSRNENQKLTRNIGELSINNNKNRFTNILPFDQTRVILQRSTSDNDYINASYIPFYDNRDSNEYIATQGPLNETITDFWWMIWEQNVSIIVMLTKLYEGITSKCEQYWPQILNDSKEFEDNIDFSVILLEEYDNMNFKERKLLLINKISMKKRKITHLHMDSWNDFSTPNLQIFEKLIYRFREITSSFNTPPYVVHCSAGVGRTGTFIAIDRIIKKIINGNEFVNIYDEVMELRRHRCFMVQQETQYLFIHNFVKYFLKKINEKDNDILFDENVYE